MKVKIVGNVALSILLAASSVLHAQVVLRVTDVYGEQMSSAVAGYPFRIEVSAKGGGKTMRRPSIEGLDTFQIEARETRMQLINGRSTMSHIYRVRVDQPGTYTIGPAVVDVDGSEMKSNVVTLPVVATSKVPQQDQSSKKRSDQKRADQVIAVLRADKQDVMIGEPVHCTLTLYAAHPDTKLVQVQEPEMPPVKISGQRGPITSTDTIKGVTYHAVSWEWDVYPQEAGTVTIPAYRLAYTVPQDDDGFGGFSAFFGLRQNVQYIYSNPLTLSVQSLPAHAGPVHATGTFGAFTAELKPAVARAGEGMMLTLRIEGNGDLATLAMPELHTMPAALKYYDSKSYITEPQKKGKGTASKSFEYVVQGIEAGEWEIPRQQFTYFDTATRTYKTATTQPIMATILARPDAGRADQKMPLESTTSDTKSQKDTQYDDGELHPIIHYGAWYPEHSWKLPLWLFMLFVLVPLLGVMCVVVWRSVRGRRSAQAATRQYKKAFSYARARLRAAERKQAYHEVHRIFVELCAARLSCKPSELSEAMLEQKLRTEGFSEDQVRAWQQFFMRSASYVFSSQNTIKDPTLWSQAYHWIATLETVL